jgi:metallo-beta-lactamase class B
MNGRRRARSLAALVIGTFAIATAAALSAQGGTPAPRIDWNARAPWGAQPNLPFDQQRKEPFKIFDNVWYVGIQTGAPYLVTTSDGLVLFDATWDETADYVLDNIRTAGFNPRDVKYVIITHAHIDHFAGAERIRKATGARVVMSLEDWKETERVQATAGQGRQNPGPKIARDMVAEDGQSLKVGDQTFTFYVTPGHTPGATSTAFQARDGNRRYRVIVPGGLGIPSAEWSQAYLTSTERLKAAGPWDVMLPNHSDMMVPKKWKDLEGDLKAYKPGAGPHPAVPGPARLDAWFDAIITLMHEKIAMERAAAPASR